VALSRWLSNFSAGIASAARADDLGVIGPVYPIAEKDLLASIETSCAPKSAAASLPQSRRRRRNARSKVSKSRSQSPTSVKRKSPDYYYDPSVIVPYPITDDAGRVLVAPERA
jgi:conjugal transfer pilus assembly protein TraW